MIEEVVVPESWFFRDERPFRWLADHVRARWITSPGRPPLHALSLPCAGGQEPYSIAITLRDAGLPAARFRIDAVDVSARLLEVVRRGVYSANSFRSPRFAARGEGLGGERGKGGEGGGGGRGGRGREFRFVLSRPSPLFPLPSSRSPSPLAPRPSRSPSSGTSAGIPRATRSTRPFARRSGSSGPMCSTRGCWRTLPLMTWCSAATS